MFRTSFKFALVGATVASAIVVSSGGAFAAPEGAATLSQQSGTSTTNFNLSISAPGSCTPGTGKAWEGYIAAKTVNPETDIVFSAGPVASTGFVSGLQAVSTDPVFGFPAPADGQISGIPQMNLSNLVGSGITAGTYNVGIICYETGGNLKVEGGHYWQTPITISNVTASNFNWAVGEPAAAPVLLSPLTGGDQSIAGSFTASASVPVTASFTITAVPQGGGTTVTKSQASAGAFSLGAADGLVNGKTYDVSVVAVNTPFSSAASNTVSVLVAPAPRAAVTGLTATALFGPDAGKITLNWTTPTGVAPTGYQITTSPAITGGSTFTVGAVNTTTLTGPYGQSTTFTVTPLHNAPYSGTPASTSAVFSYPAAVIQDITVTRPAGVLILTQRCDVWGALPAELLTAEGYPATPAVTASGNQTGTAPTLTLGGAADGQFNNYPAPVPASYPTHCGIDLGTAALITSGPLAGNYYHAEGQISQVTVLDTREVDAGWTVNGTMSDFTTTGDAFGGDLLGWSPKVTYTSDPISGVTTYDQIVTAGAKVNPNTVNGLGNGEVLSSSIANQGLGIASMDARLKLLIPVTATSGVYTGTLTFTLA